MTSWRQGPPAWLVLVLFLFSGATGLVYQVVWLRLLILIFGSTQFATSTVLSTFMAGLALGAFLAGRWMTRRRANPLLVYGALEIGIGIYAVLTPFLFDALTPVYRMLWGAGLSESFVLLSLAKFVGIALVLLPPTILMGASLPALARWVADDERRIGGKVGALYATNTFGAVLGVLVAGFFALPTIGVLATLWISAVVNAVLGTVAIVVGRGAIVPADAAAPTPATDGPGSWRIRLALIAFGFSGFGALVLEVAWTRVLALVMGSSVYAFSLMLVAFLVGLAAGGAFFSGVLRRRPGIDPATMLAALLGAAGLLSWATTYLFQALPRLFAEVFYQYSPGPGGWFLVQLVFGLLIMFPATFALGGIFPTVLQLHARSLAAVSGSVGTVYASNTVGTILGAAVAGFLLIPGLGVLPTVVAVAVLEILLGLVVALFVVRRGQPGRVALAATIAVAALVAVAARPGWDVRLMNSGVYMNLYGTDSERGWEGFEQAIHANNEVVFAAEGLTASVFVADQPDFDNRYLSVNGKIEASTNADLETQIMCAHLPLLLHRSPADVLIIGLASGISVGAAATHPVDSIRVVEIEKEMIPAARLFAEYNNNVLDDRRVTVSINDARNELEFSDRTYDVIISEPSNPWMTVAANLFTEDFFRMARERVRPGGIFCQWIQNYYLPKEDLRSIIAAFQASFPHVLLFETFDGVDLLMLGSQDPLTIDLASLDARMHELRVGMDLGRIGADSPEEVLSLFRIGPEGIRRLVANAPRNTDDNARVEFSAPKTLGVYTIDENLAMLRRHTTDPLEVLLPAPAGPEERDRLRLALARIWAARGYPDLAADAARLALDGPLHERAAELLADLEAASRDSD